MARSICPSWFTPISAMTYGRPPGTMVREPSLSIDMSSPVAQLVKRAFDQFDHGLELPARHPLMEWNRDHIVEKTISLRAIRISKARLLEHGVTVQGTVLDNGL